MADDERTPPAVLITVTEKRVVRVAVRTFVKAVVPQLPMIAKLGGPAAVAFLLTTAHTWADKAETDKKVAAAEQNTKQAYKIVAKPTVEISAGLAAVLKRLDTIEATQKAQSAVITAEHDFVIQGRPATKAQRRKVDAGLVKVVKENAAVSAKELAARKAKPTQAITPIPLELPPAPPTPSPLPQPQQIRDAGKSP